MVTISKRLISGLLFWATIAFVILAITEGFLSVNIDNSFYRISFFTMLLWSMIEITHKWTIKQGTQAGVSSIIIAAFVLLLASLIQSNDGLSLQGFTYLGCLLCMLIALLTNERSKFEIVGFNITILVGTVFFLYAYNIYQHQYYSTLSKTIGTFNPQAVGSWAYIYCASMIMTLDTYIVLINKKWIKRVLFILVTISALLLSGVSIETNSRGAMVGIIFFLVFRLMPILQMPQSKYWNFFILVFPVLVVLFGILLFHIGFFVRDGIGLLDGRENLWEDLMIRSEGLLLIGNYSKMKDVYAHNIFLDHILRYGLIFEIPYAIALYTTLSKAGEGCCISRNKYDAYMGFCGALIVSSIEGMIFSTGAGGIYFISFAMLIMSISE